MRFVGKGLNHAGFTVHGMQLAGHCGDESDLLASGWRDWYASVDEAATRLRNQVDRLFVGGLSMGALLALKLAADRPQDVDGLALYGTTFRYDGWNMPRMSKLSFLLPLATRLGIGRGRRFMETAPYGIRDERIRERVAGSMLAGDSAAAGLPGNPWPSLAQFQLLSRQVRRQLNQVRAPSLVVHSSDDDIASIGNAHLVQQHVRGAVDTLLLDDSYHMVTVDRERHRVIAKSAEFFAGLALGGTDSETGSPSIAIPA